MGFSDRSFYTTVVVSLFIVISAQFIEAQDSCKKENSCKCIFESGQVLDLSALGREDGTPRFNISTKVEDRFLWNPCFAFNVSGGCTDVAICEIRPYLPSDEDYALGYQSDVTFTTNDTDRTVQLTYVSKGDGKTPVRMSFISLECDSGDADNSTFEAVDIPDEDSDTTKYYFKLRSPYACVQAPTTEGTRTSIETTATTVTILETTTTSHSPETTNPSPETSPSRETNVTIVPTTGITTESPTSSPTVPSSSTSSSIGTSVSTHSPTTPKPESHRTLTVALICVALVIVGVAVGVTLMVLKKRGKICKPPEYDNL